MAKKVTQEDIEKMNKLYYELHTYSAVAREVGFSAATVKRYIVEGYIPVNKENIIKWNGVLAAAGTYQINKSMQWTEEELAKIDDLRKEIEI